MRPNMAPPQIKSNIVLKHKYRFTSSANGTYVVPSVALLAAAGSFTKTTNSIVNSLFGSVKLDRIEMWSPPASQGSFATCSVEFIGQTQANTVEYSDTSVSTAQPAHLNCVPPPQSLASFWQTGAGGGVNLFTIVAPVGSIIDVSLSLILWDDDIGATSTAVATAALGNVYYLALDNATGHSLPPVSLTTTF